MFNVIQLKPASSSGGKSSTMNSASDAGSSFAAGELAVLNRQSLGAIFLGIDAISAMLDFIQKTCDALPDGSQKDLLKEQKRRLSFELFEIRMIAIRLSYDSGEQGGSSAIGQIDRLRETLVRAVGSSTNTAA